MLSYSHLVTAGSGFVLGSLLFWQVGTWRLDAVKLKDTQNDNKVLTEQLVAKQDQIEKWMKQVKEDTDKVAQIIQDQEGAREEAAKQTDLLAKQVAEIKNVAKTLAPTNVKLDAAHQLLLKAISSAANSPVAGATKTDSTKDIATEGSTFPQFADRRFR